MIYIVKRMAEPPPAVSPSALDKDEHHHLSSSEIDGDQPLYEEEEIPVDNDEDGPIYEEEVIEAGDGDDGMPIYEEEEIIEDDDEEDRRPSALESIQEEVTERDISENGSSHSSTVGLPAILQTNAEPSNTPQSDPPPYRSSSPELSPRRSIAAEKAPELNPNRAGFTAPLSEHSSSIEEESFGEEDIEKPPLRPRSGDSLSSVGSMSMSNSFASEDDGDGPVPIAMKQKFQDLEEDDDEVPHNGDPPVDRGVDFERHPLIDEEEHASPNNQQGALAPLARGPGSARKFALDAETHDPENKLDQQDTNLNGYESTDDDGSGSFFDDTLEDVKRQEQQQHRRYTYPILCFVLLVIAAAAILIPLLLNNNNDSNRDSSGSGPPILPPPVAFPNTNAPSPFLRTPAPTLSPQAPGNDSCQQAIELPLDGSGVMGSIANASPDTVEPCETIPNDGHVGVWFKIKGTGGEMMANTCSNTPDDLDTKISVYQGSSCNKLTCLSANDNFCGVHSATPWQSNLGETYYIYLHVNAEDAETIEDPTFEISIVTRNNGQCEYAVGPDLAATEDIHIGDTSDGLPVNILCNETLDDTPGAWYKMIGTGAEHRISVCDESSYDPKITVLLANDCDQELQCLQTTQPEQCSLSFTSIPFEEYFVVVSGHDNESSGMFGIQVLQQSPPPPNYSCSDAVGPVPLNGRSIVGSTQDASFQTGLPFCEVSVAGRGVWYYFEGSGNAFRISSCGGTATSFDTRLAIYKGDCPESLTCIAGNDDFCGAQSLLTIASTEVGERYYILIHGHLDDAGEYELSVTEII